MLRHMTTGLAGALLLAISASPFPRRRRSASGSAAWPTIRAQPVEVTADNLTIDQATGEAVFSGNVIVHQGDLRMAAGQVRVLYSDTDGQRSVDEVWPRAVSS
jgi:lipopolysaccharide export system protein LptA